MKSSTRTPATDDLEDRLDEALDESFPTSDPPSLTQPGSGAPTRAPAVRKGQGVMKALVPILALFAVAGWWIGSRQRRASKVEDALEALRRHLRALDPR